ncbi:unnamed protein product, partial [Iphiclides podalirius]
MTTEFQLHDNSDVTSRVLINRNSYCLRSGRPGADHNTPLSEQVEFHARRALAKLGDNELKRRELDAFNSVDASKKRRGNLEGFLSGFDISSN